MINPPKRSLRSIVIQGTAFLLVIVVLLMAAHYRQKRCERHCSPQEAYYSDGCLGFISECKCKKEECR